MSVNEKGLRNAGRSQVCTLTKQNCFNSERQSGEKRMQDERSLQLKQDNAATLASVRVLRSSGKKEKGRRNLARAHTFATPLVPSRALAIAIK